MSDGPGRWWYLDLAAEYPEPEIYVGHGWGPAQELGLIELGERVMTEEALWLLTWIYSSERDKIQAAVLGMFRMVMDRVRRDRPEAEQVILALQGDDGAAVHYDEIPFGWCPPELETLLKGRWVA